MIFLVLLVGLNVPAIKKVLNLPQIKLSDFNDLISLEANQINEVVGVLILVAAIKNILSTFSLDFGPLLVETVEFAFQFLVIISDRSPCVISR